MVYCAKAKQEECGSCESNGETPEFPADTFAATGQQLDKLDAEIARIDLERDEAFVTWWKSGVESYTAADKDLNANIDIDELYEYLMRTIRCDKAEAAQILSKQRILLNQLDSEVVVVLLAALSLILSYCYVSLPYDCLLPCHFVPGQRQHRVHTVCRSSVMLSLLS